MLVNSVWPTAGLWLGVYMALGLVVGIWADWEWGLLTLALCFLGAWLNQLRHLARIVAWAAQPAGTAPPDAAGEWGLLCAHLTKRIRTANALREELSRRLERFREAWEAMPDGVVNLGPGQTIEWFNTAASRFFALQKGTDVGAPFTNLVRRPELVALLRQGPSSEPLILAGMRPSDPLLSVQVIPFGVSQTLVVARDISHLAKLERMRSDFVANVSHELKTPLTVVSGFVETLLDFGDELSLDERTHYLNLVMDQSRRMQGLVDDLLTLAALESDGPPAHEEHLSIAICMGAVVDEAQALSAGRHRIELVPGRDGELFASAKEIHSALANLASNAVRYTPEHGTIRLTWQLDAQGLTLQVCDNGIGISAEHLPRLTERFYRVDRGRSRENGGTGLGLAIVKHVMTRHQGELRIDSHPGKGSCFAMHFPASRVAPSGTPPAAPASSCLCTFTGDESSPSACC